MDTVTLSAAPSAAASLPPPQTSPPPSSSARVNLNGSWSNGRLHIGQDAPQGTRHCHLEIRQWPSQHRSWRERAQKSDPQFHHPLINHDARRQRLLANRVENFPGTVTPSRRSISISAARTPTIRLRHATTSHLPPSYTTIGGIFATAETNPVGEDSPWSVSAKSH